MPTALKKSACALLAAATIGVLAPAPAHAGRGDCGQPSSSGPLPTTSDCLFMLRVSIGVGACDPPCVCDVNATGTVSASDALLCLKKAVGQDVELNCLCPGQSTTTTNPTSTTVSGPTTTTIFGPTTTTGGTTTTVISGDACPQQADIAFLASVRSQCTTNADCLAGACDPELLRCVTPTALDLGWRGRAHDADLNDAAHLLATLQCPGTAGACGACTIAGVDAAARNCRCADDNRRICDEPFAADEDACDGAQCVCYLGPPLPLSAGSSPICLLNRMFGDATGTVDPDTGGLELQVELRTMAYQGTGPTVPCPTCGGRCLAPEARLDVPCNLNADCNTEEEQGECGRYDTVAADGEREGLCVGGENAGFGCDMDAVNTTFPAPGGGGTSLDCFPEPGANMSGQGLIVNLNATTATASIGTGVPCGFTLPGADRLCPCGQCGDDSSSPCASNVDCTAPATCATESGTAFPTECDDEVCTVDAAGEGTCANGPIDRFCDQIVRANGRGLINCQNNADCAAEVVGTPGACTLEEARECFPTIISAVGDPDPRIPVAVAVSCIASTSSSALNDSIGLPGAMRLVSQLALTGRCQSGSSLPYVPEQGCP